MTARTPLSTRIQAAFRPTDRGISGIVDEILALSLEHDLQMIWQADACQVIANGGTETVSIPLGKSVFRAKLARLAAICTSTSGEMLSPYGGEGIYHFESNPAVVIHVEFTNTADDQRLSLNPERAETADSRIVEAAVAG